MKFMKWTDLEPGDIVKWTKEAIKRFGSEGWFHFYGENETLEIESIRESTTELYLTFTKSPTIHKYIIRFNKNDGRYIGIVLFEIIKLRED